jgi:hypothetical protein
MSNPFLTYQQFNKVEQFNEATQVLIDAGIPYQSEDSHQFFDPSYLRNDATRDIRVLVQQNDFGKANTAFKKFYTDQLDKVDPNYFLFQFNKAELKSVISNPEEWGMFNCMLAEKLLNDLGEATPPGFLEEIEIEKLYQAKEAEKASPTLIIIGYLSLIILGIGGAIFGLYIVHTKKTLIDGSQFYRFDATSRNHGKIMLAIFTIILILLLLLFTNH